MERSAWLKTPYANTKARDPDSAIVSLLERYKIAQHSITHDTGTSGRPGFGVRFKFDGLWYVIAFETLEVKGVEARLLLAQVKRIVFYTIKTVLEAGTVFMSTRKLLLPFLEVQGKNLYECLEPHLQQLQCEPGHYRALLPCVE